MGCQGVHWLSIYARFGGKKRTSCIFLGKKTIIIASKHSATILFSHHNLFLRKLKEKLARKARVNTERVYRILLMPPGHPIILLKSNKFNMAAISVKRSIVGAGLLQEWFSYADTKGIRVKWPLKGACPATNEYWKGEKIVYKVFGYTIVLMTLPFRRKHKIQMVC